MQENYVTVQEIMERVQMNLPVYTIQKYMNFDECVLHIYDGLRKVGMLQGNAKELVKLRLEENRARIPEFVEQIISISYADIQLNRVDILDENYQTYTYVIENGYIISDLDECDIYMLVSRLPLAEDGNPLIINKMYAISAVTAYLTERLCFKLYFQDIINEHKYERIKQEWLFYSGQARTASLMPSIDEEYALSKSMLRVLPKFSRGKKESTGKQYQIKQVPLQDLNTLVTKQYNG